MVAAAPKGVVRDAGQMLVGLGTKEGDMNVVSLLAQGAGQVRKLHLRTAAGGVADDVQKAQRLQAGPVGRRRLGGCVNR